MAYCLIRNLVNSKLEHAHNAYYNRLFDDSFSGNRRQFWKYIQALCKEPSGISTLQVNDQCISDPKGKFHAASLHHAEKTYLMYLSYKA